MQRCPATPRAKIGRNGQFFKQEQVDVPLQYALDELVWLHGETSAQSFLRFGGGDLQLRRVDTNDQAVQNVKRRYQRIPISDLDVIGRQFQAIQDRFLFSQWRWRTPKLL